MIVARKRDGSSLAVAQKSGVWSVRHPTGRMEYVDGPTAAAELIARDGLGTDDSAPDDHWRIDALVAELPREFNEALAKALTVYSVRQDDGD